MKHAAWGAALAAGLLLAGCASKERNVPITDQNFRPAQDYRPWSRDGEALPDRHIILTFSGGGTRAAALAQGVLRELAATEFTDRAGRPRRLTDEVDLVSSVSGGSVTAANFALHGPTGFDAFERGFLRHNGMGEIVLGVLNPVNEAGYILLDGQRTDLLVDMLDREVLHGARYADLLAAGDRDRRPYLVLNAADMSSGLSFPFTQSQFDLLCSDLSQFRLADAVAASAAFPVGMTPIMLRNYNTDPSGCKARGGAEWTDRISHVVEDVGDDLHSFPDAGDGVRRQASDALFVGMSGLELARRGPALRRKEMIAPASGKRYVHLLDGGIADNLGLGEPLRMVSAAGVDGFGGRINNGPIRELVFIVVNSRSQSYSDRDSHTATPGVVSMLTTSIDAAIDGRTGGLQAQLDLLPQVAASLAGREKPVKVTVVTVDFDLIRDDRCRRDFQSIGTNWHLEDPVVDSLLDMGSAMLRASAQYQDLVRQLNGRGPEGPAASGSGPWPGQALAQGACDRLGAWAEAQKRAKAS
ncbi:patatin-like phospholipase family protein [Azospirillum sp. sgz302134]